MPLVIVAGGVALLLLLMIRFAERLYLSGAGCSGGRDRTGYAGR